MRKLKMRIIFLSNFLFFPPIFPPCFLHLFQWQCWGIIRVVVWMRKLNIWISLYAAADASTGQNQFRICICLGISIFALVIGFVLAFLSFSYLYLSWYFCLCFCSWVCLGISAIFRICICLGISDMIIYFIWFVKSLLIWHAKIYNGRGLRSFKTRYRKYIFASTVSLQKSQFLHLAHVILPPIGNLESRRIFIQHL